MPVVQPPAPDLICLRCGHEWNTTAVSEPCPRCRAVTRRLLQVPTAGVWEVGRKRVKPRDKWGRLVKPE